MAERLYVGTRKGLFELAPDNGQWDIAATHFLGDPVSAVLAQGDAVYAALDLGHFEAKLWRLDRGCLGEHRWRRLVEHHQRGHVQRIHAAGAERPADRAGHPSPRALRRISRNRVVPAP